MRWIRLIRGPNPESKKPIRYGAHLRVTLHHFAQRDSPAPYTAFRAKARAADPWRGQRVKSTPSPNDSRVFHAGAVTRFPQQREPRRGQLHAPTLLIGNACEREPANETAHVTRVMPCHHPYHHAAAAAASCMLARARAAQCRPSLADRSTAEGALKLTAGSRALVKPRRNAHATRASE